MTVLGVWCTLMTHAAIGFALVLSDRQWGVAPQSLFMLWAAGRVSNAIFHSAINLLSAAHLYKRTCVVRPSRTCPSSLTLRGPSALPSKVRCIIWFHSLRLNPVQCLMDWQYIQKLQFSRVTTRQLLGCVGHIRLSCRGQFCWGVRL